VLVSILEIYGSEQYGGEKQDGGQVCLQIDDRNRLYAKCFPLNA